MEKISPEAMAAYRRTARLRAAADTKRRRQRLEHALEVARRASALLRQRFQAEQVVIFGSLLRPEHFSERSDVDLAVRGLADQDFLRAVAAVTSLDPEITIDLVAIEEASPSLRQRIEHEGMEI
ncbi:MAG: nucleotidyltransferase family protein [Desulfobacteraceae bacterium]